MSNWIIYEHLKTNPSSTPTFLTTANNPKKQTRSWNLHFLLSPKKPPISFLQVFAVYRPAVAFCWAWAREQPQRVCFTFRGGVFVNHSAPPWRNPYLTKTVVSRSLRGVSVPFGPPVTQFLPYKYRCFTFTKGRFCTVWPTRDAIPTLQIPLFHVH